MNLSSLTRAIGILQEFTESLINILKAEIPGKQFPHFAFEQEEREELVRRAVLALPPRYRDAIIVFYFREMDLKEAAAILNVPEGTVKSWLHRGRELLKDKLGMRFSQAETIEEVVT